MCDLLEVYDEDGNAKASEEAVEVWKENFTKVLGASNEGAVGDDGMGWYMHYRKFPRDIPDIFIEQGVVYDTECQASLMMEMESLPVVWEARLRCVGTRY